MRGAQTRNLILFQGYVPATFLVVLDGLGALNLEGGVDLDFGLVLEGFSHDLPDTHENPALLGHTGEVRFHAPVNPTTPILHRRTLALSRGWRWMA